EGGCGVCRGGGRVGRGQPAALFYPTAAVVYPAVGGAGGHLLRATTGSSTQPLLAPSFRLPPIVENCGRMERLGGLMVGRLCGADIADFLFSHEALPPIRTIGVHGDRSATPQDAARTKSSLSVQTLLIEQDHKPMPRYPVRHKTREDFMQDVKRAHQTNNYVSIQRFYMRCFDTYAQLNALFKVKREDSSANADDPGLKMEFVYAVNDALRSMPSIVHKTVLKSIINALLEDNRVLYPKDDVRALFVLVQNPVFAAQSSYTILAHLLKQIVALPSADHQLLVHWFQL
ncbi:hypothetical protein AAG570_003317, partial [Ranatra chinensis]